MEPFVSVLVTEDVADACRRGEPVLETVTDVAMRAFVDLGIDPVANPPRLESIERDEDEYGEFWKVTFRIPERGRGGFESLGACRQNPTTPFLSHEK